MLRRYRSTVSLEFHLADRDLLLPRRNDIPGFQNRMGLFFFVLALFGFSCLTSLEVFAKERILFMRERSNGYYSPFTYFTAKVRSMLLDVRSCLLKAPLAGAIRCPPASRHSALHLGSYHLSSSRPRPNSCTVLEIYPRLNHVQYVSKQHRILPQHCDQQFRCCQLGWQSGHALQVSGQMNLCSIITLKIPFLLVFYSLVS